MTKTTGILRQKQINFGLDAGLDVLSKDLALHMDEYFNEYENDSER